MADFSIRAVKSTTETSELKGTKLSVPVLVNVRRRNVRGDTESHSSEFTIKPEQTFLHQHPKLVSDCSNVSRTYSGITLPTALAAPVELGMMLAAAPRPPRQSFPEGPSTVFWVALWSKSG